MFLSASLSVDPSQMTKIQPIPPTKVFKKLLFILSSGNISEKEEVETLTALSVLQQLNMVFRSLGITNIVRLSKDDIDFYLDEEGKADDLKETLDKFSYDVDEIESEVFKTLDLVLEHTDKEFSYLIEIFIRRIHKVGEPPIQIKVNGVMKEFQTKTDQPEKEIEAKLKPVFDSNEKYQSFVKGKQLKFDQFVSSLEVAIRKAIRIDQIKVESNAKIVRPKERVKKEIPSAQRQAAEPVFYGYPGWGNAFFYAWMWSSMCHTHDIHVNNSTLVDDNGANIMSVGEQGFNAGENNALNVDQPFEPPQTSDAVYYDNNEYAGEIQNAGLSDGGFDSSDDTRNAFSDFSDNSDSSSDSGDSGSSCSSCSSCGGGD
jgi:hypothetical protein